MGASTDFIAATISTTGYGDVVPRTVPGKMVTALLLVVVLVLIPKQAEKLLALLSARSVYVRQWYRYDTGALVAGARQV